MTVQLGSDEKSQVTLFAEDLTNIDTKGLHFKLPDGTPPVDIGSLTTLIDFVNDKLGIEIPDKADTSWPETIQTIFNGVLNVEVSVTKFNFDQAPKGTDGKYPDPEFSLAVTGTAMDPADKTKTKPISVAGFFSIVGGGIGITRTNNPAT